MVIALYLGISIGIVGWMQVVNRIKLKLRFEETVKEKLKIKNCKLNQVEKKKTVNKNCKQKSSSDLMNSKTKNPEMTQILSHNFFS